MKRIAFMKIRFMIPRIQKKSNICLNGCLRLEISTKALELGKT